MGVLIRKNFTLEDRTTKGGNVLHIGHFSFDEQNDDLDNRHGYFTCVVDVNNPEDAISKFAGYILEMKSSESCFANMKYVYIEDIIKIATVPEEPITTWLQSSEGRFPRSTSYSLPSAVKNGIDAYGMLSNVAKHEKDESGQYLYSNPFIEFN